MGNHENLEMQTVEARLQSTEERLSRVEQQADDVMEYLQTLKSKVETEKQALMSKCESQAEEIKALEELVAKLQAELAKVGGDVSPSEGILVKNARHALKFENTEEFALTFVIENQTGVPMKLEGASYVNDLLEGLREYEKMPAEIPANGTESFGFTKYEPFQGFFSYQIFDKLLVFVKFDVNDRNKAVTFSLELLERVKSGAALNSKLTSGDLYSVGFYSPKIIGHDAGESEQKWTILTEGSWEGSVCMTRGKKGSVTIRVTHTEGTPGL